MRRCAALLQRRCSLSCGCCLPQLQSSTLSIWGGLCALLSPMPSGNSMLEKKEVRWNACRIDTMEFAKESANLLELITKLTLNQPILQPPMQQQGGGFGGRQQGAAAGRHISTIPHNPLLSHAGCSQLGQRA